MRNLFTVTLLLLSLNLSANEDPCKKADRLKTETLLTMTKLNIDESKLQSLFIKVIGAVSESRNYEDVIESMLLNKTINSDYYLAIDLFMKSFKQRMICQGKY